MSIYQAFYATEKNEIAENAEALEIMMELGKSLS